MDRINQADRIAFSHGAGIANGMLADTRLNADRLRGRGAAVNPMPRFDRYQRESFDDGWQAFEDLPPFATEVEIDKSRSVISHNDSPDLPFDQSINPYRGCEHGCVYCFARPTHAYLGLSPGLEFETKLFAKPDAARLLEREIGKPSYEVKTLAIGTNTDPYQPVEKKYRIMRDILEVLDAASHPVTIVTKSALVTRDIDILSRMAERGLAKVAVSVTTMDRGLARAMEPRASTTSRRLEALRALSEAGVPTSVLVAPVVPGLTDHEMERILDAAAAQGVKEARYILLRLPLEVAPLFKEWLLRTYPDRYKHVMSLLRSMRGGKDYDAEFGKRMSGSGPYAWQIGRRFELAAKRHGLNIERWRLRSDLFAAPQLAGAQLNLF
jgi:DNA repair photolyase